MHLTNEQSIDNNNLFFAATKQSYLTHKISKTCKQECSCYIIFLKLHAYMYGVAGLVTRELAYRESEVIGRRWGEAFHAHRHGQVMSGSKQ